MFDNLINAWACAPWSCMQALLNAMKRSQPFMVLKVDFSDESAVPFWRVQNDFETVLKPVGTHDFEQNGDLCRLKMEQLWKFCYPQCRSSLLRSKRNWPQPLYIPRSLRPLWHLFCLLLSGAHLALCLACCHSRDAPYPTSCCCGQLCESACNICSRSLGGSFDGFHASGTCV